AVLTSPPGTLGDFREGLRARCLNYWLKSSVDLGDDTREGKEESGIMQDESPRTDQLGEEAKKPYTQPQLQVYGDLREITHGHGKSINDNGKGRGGGTRA